LKPPNIQEIAIAMGIGIEIGSWGGVTVSFFDSDFNTDTDFEFTIHMKLRSWVKI
jgi:hypothetical protein